MFTKSAITSAQVTAAEKVVIVFVENITLMLTNMKAQLRIPTAEAYAYIEVSVEGTEEEVIKQYHRLTNAVRGGFGLDDKQFNACLDEYLTTNNIKNGTELYAEMSLSQQSVFQEVKKAMARLKNKNK